MSGGVRRLVVPWLLVLGGLGGACGSSTTSPTPTAPSGAVDGPVVNVAGMWTGTFESANFSTRTITLTVVQGGSCVDGAWISTSSDWSGAISGYAGANSFSGQFSFERSATGGGICTAAGSISGDVGPATLRWTSTDLAAVGPCAGDLPKAIILTLQRASN